jgi:uncharacterized small protein (DUF1192 family)
MTVYEEANEKPVISIPSLLTEIDILEAKVEEWKEKCARLQARAERVKAALDEIEASGLTERPGAFLDGYFSAWRTVVAVLAEPTEEGDHA